MTMDDASKTSACICMAVPIAAYFGSVAIGLEGRILNYIVMIGAVIGLALAALCMISYWRDFQ